MYVPGRYPCMALHAVLKRAVSLSEIGPVQMQGDGYTEILGGENGAIILTQPYSPGEEGKRVYLYSETENTIKEADTDEFKEMLSEILCCRRFWRAFPVNTRLRFSTGRSKSWNLIRRSMVFWLPMAKS